MRNILTLVICILGFSQIDCSQENRKDFFPDGTKISAWFLDTAKIRLNDLGRQFVITEFGALIDSTVLQTIVIQNTIDEASR
jgi:hypothetical protein